MKKNKKIINTLSVLIVTLTLFITVSFIKVNAYEYNEKERIDSIIEELVDNGTLPYWHEFYLSDPSYHQVFQKYYNQDDPAVFEYFAALSREEVRKLCNTYSLKGYEFNFIIDDLQVPLETMEPGITCGLMFNGQHIFLLWTSPYIPNELLNLEYVRIKDHRGESGYFNTPLNCCEHIEAASSFHTEQILHRPSDNIQLNITYIGGYYPCEVCQEVYTYGIDLKQGEVTIQGWKTELDKFQGGSELDPHGYYDFINEEPMKFNLTTDFTYGGRSVAQISCHRFVEITDVICQSSYDLNFGGYKHFVYFNTSIDIQSIYRVDVGYKLLAQDEKWTAQFVNNTKERQVLKSLTAQKASGGLFNLFNYKGFEQGSYSSNEKDTITYKYKLHLNYDEGAWEWDTVFDDDHREKDYTKIKQFQVLRLNFLYKGQEFDVPVEMDTIDGETVSIFDRNQVLDTDTILWEVKDETFEVIDKVDDFVNNDDGESKLVTTLKVLATVTATIAIIYVGYKIYGGIKIMKKGNKK